MLRSLTFFMIFNLYYNFLPKYIRIKDNRLTFFLFSHFYFIFYLLSILKLRFKGQYNIKCDCHSHTITCHIEENKRFWNNNISII